MQISSALLIQIELQDPFDRTSQPGQNIVRFMYSNWQLCMHHLKLLIILKLHQFEISSPITKKVHLLILCVYNCFIKYAGVFYGSGNFFWSRLPRKYRHKACLNNNWSNLLSHDMSQFSQTSDFANMQFVKCSQSFCVIAWSVCWGLFHKHTYYSLHSLQRLMIVTKNEKSLLCTLRMKHNYTLFICFKN